MWLRRTSRAACTRSDAEWHEIVFYAPTVGDALKGTAFLPRGGAEKQVVMLARGLTRQGYRVAIVVRGRKEELPDVVDGVTIRVRSNPTRGRGVVGKMLEAIRICRALANVPSRWIVVRGATVDLGIIAIYAPLVRRRVVFASASVADFDASRLEPNRLYARLYTLGVRLSRSVVVQTDEQAPPCRQAFRRNPRVIRSISPLAPAQDQRPTAFLWVGRLVGYKRPLEYIRLARAIPEATFWMVGIQTPHVSGDEVVIDAVLAQAKTVPNLELLAPRPPEELQRLMARAVASVNTADFEGMSNVLLEGWSQGVPALVLTYDPDGVVSKHGLGAFAAGDMERFAASARELWRTRDDRADLALRCRDYIATHHSPARIAQQWAELFQS